MNGLHITEENRLQGRIGRGTRQRRLTLLAQSVILVALLAALLGPPFRVEATPPVSGASTSFGSKSDVEQGTGSVNAIAASDLDGDGDLDLVTGSNSGNHELSARRNDGTPFDDTWSCTDLRDDTATVYAVAVADLDKDGDPDVISGDTDRNVIIWRNDGTPFGGDWDSHRSIGSGAGDILALGVGDLDRDGDLDVISGSADDAGSTYEIIVWENPWTTGDTNPFDQSWSSHDVQNVSKNVNSLAICDLDGDGWPDVTAGYQNVSGDEITAWENIHDSAAWTFTERSVGSSPGGGSVNGVACGDLDRDGSPDVISGATGGASTEIVAWEYAGDWSFTRHDVGTGDTAESVALADLNADGTLDVAVATDAGGSGDGHLYVWENDADATFDWSFTQVTVGNEAGEGLRVVAAGDLDGDGDADLATGRESGTGNEVAVWQNTLIHRHAPFDAGGNDGGASADTVYSIALGDLDADGDPDVVSGSGSGEDYEIIAWRNDGTPFTGLWTQNDVGGGSSVLSLALGDLDRDGDLDLVTGDGGNDVCVWQNDGTPFDGDWSGTDVGDAAGAVNALFVADLDRDGWLDVASGDANADVLIWRNDGTPFGDPWSSTDVGDANGGVNALSVADLDHDGWLDVASGDANADVLIWRNDGTPFGDPWSSTDVGAANGGVNSLSAGDLDRDGRLDLVSGDASADVLIWRNDGTPFGGPWSSTDVGDAAGAVNALSVADLNRDGRPDIVSGDAANRIDVWENDGTPWDSWTSSPAGIGTDAIDAVTAGDLDGDGDADLISGSGSGEDYELVAWRNVGGTTGLDVTDTAPQIVGQGERDDLLRVVVTHHGLAGDGGIELNRWDLLLEEQAGDPLTTAEAQALFQNVYVYLDDGDGDYAAGQDTTAVATIASGDISLDDGVQSVSFTDGDGDVQVGATGSKTYFVVVETTADAGDQTPHDFRVTFDPDADAVVEDAVEGSSLSIADTAPSSGTGSAAASVGDSQPIDGAGEYAFEDTGVSIAFSSEEIDDVSVSSHRDTFLLSGEDTVKCYYEIEATGGSGSFGATVRLAYTEAEFEASGITDESSLRAWRWDGDAWQQQTGGVDTARNVVTATGVTAFSNWILGGNEPTAVILSVFAATSTCDHVLVEWETADEVDLVGFHLERSSASGGPYTRLNPILIPAQKPGSPIGAAYAYTDTTVTGGDYWYRLEIVETGSNELTEPIHITYYPRCTFLPLIVKADPGDSPYVTAEPTEHAEETRSGSPGG